MTTSFKKVGDSLIRSGYSPIPSSVGQCKECGYFDVSDPLMVEYMAKRGMELMMAACRCKSYMATQRDIDDNKRIWANLPNEHSPRYLSNFRPVDGTADAINAAREFCEGVGPNVLVLAGSVGCGKSHLLESMARSLFTSGKSTRYILAPILIDELRAAEGKGNVYDLLDRYDATHNLLIDDLGMERPTEYVLETFTKMIEKRIQYGSPYNRLVIATNLVREDMVNQYDQRIADRLWSTTAQDVKTVVMSAESYRQNMVA